MFTARPSVVGKHREITGEFHALGAGKCYLVNWETTFENACNLIVITNLITAVLIDHRQVCCILCRSCSENSSVCQRAHCTRSL